MEEVRCTKSSDDIFWDYCFSMAFLMEHHGSQLILSNEVTTSTLHERRGFIRRDVHRIGILVSIHCVFATAFCLHDVVV